MIINPCNTCLIQKICSKDCNDYTKFYFKLERKKNVKNNIKAFFQIVGIFATLFLIYASNILK